MFRNLIGSVLFILLFLVIGNIILEEFPTIQPIWEEIKGMASNLYNISLVKYGSIPTLLIGIAVFILIGSSKR